MAERGFTLVELGFVALILGMIVALVWPNLRRYARATLTRAEADDVQARLREARMKAVIERCDVTVDLQTLRDHTASVPFVRFYVDGTADPVVITPRTAPSAVPRLSLDASGRFSESALP